MPEQTAQQPLQQPIQAQQQVPQQEQPQYVLTQKKVRALLPNILTLIILAVIFYLGLLLNISLIKLNTDEETTAKLISGALILVLIVIGIVMNIIKSKRPYNFYSNRISFGKKTLQYTEILNITAKRNIVDKIFKTYSIPLTKKFILKNIPQETQIEGYLQQITGRAQPQMQTAPQQPIS